MEDTQNKKIWKHRMKNNNKQNKITANYLSTKSIFNINIGNVWMMY